MADGLLAGDRDRDHPGTRARLRPGEVVRDCVDQPNTRAEYHEENKGGAGMDGSVDHPRDRLGFRPCGGGERLR